MLREGLVGLVDLRAVACFGIPADGLGVAAIAAGRVATGRGGVATGRVGVARMTRGLSDLCSRRGCPCSGGCRRPLRLPSCRSTSARYRYWRCRRYRPSQRRRRRLLRVSPGSLSSRCSGTNWGAGTLCSGTSPCPDGSHNSGGPSPLSSTRWSGGPSSYCRLGHRRRWPWRRRHCRRSRRHWSRWCRHRSSWRRPDDSGDLRTLAATGAAFVEGNG